ncbi:DNA starvation/stationary phase protection protein [Parachlamydia sp. AcF125]|uniref:Dps family protein n=1 Tax=Parachlamydia sp. AcF125 TaxID=2795736 RepID=UPI001BC91FC2|nr:DNA starvation/stationary phase protection protein [Parachlamydia sp. AcF125]MBS4167430.1 DNA protection during starvation protein 1 [Parachlamydia sp. AcF125]
MKTSDLKSEPICKSLAQVLADTYILYVKTQNFHWNVVDPRFYSLHKMLEDQYAELAEALDEIAERMRMLNGKSPATMKKFLELGSLSEAEGGLSGDEMLQILINDHAALIKTVRKKIEEAQTLQDEGTADMLIQRLRAHEKNHWMLQSHFKEK